MRYPRETVARTDGVSFAEIEREFVRGRLYPDFAWRAHEVFSPLNALRSPAGKPGRVRDHRRRTYGTRGAVRHPHSSWRPVVSRVPELNSFGRYCAQPPRLRHAP